MATVSYLINIAKDVEATATNDINYPQVAQKLRALDGELKKLEPADFLQSVQSEFVTARERLRNLISKDYFFPEQARDLAKQLVVVLENYGGEGSGKYRVHLISLRMPA